MVKMEVMKKLKYLMKILRKENYWYMLWEPLHNLNKLPVDDTETTDMPELELLLEVEDKDRDDGETTALLDS